MSKIGDYIGDRFPNVKNALGTLEAKVGHTGILARLKFFGRGVKVTLVNAFKSLKRSAKDTPLHPARLRKRDITLLNAMHGDTLKPADMLAMAAQGNAAARKEDLQNLLEFMKSPDNLAAVEAGIARAGELEQQEIDRLDGLNQGLKRAGQEAGLEVLQGDRKFAEASNHSTQRKDWESKLTIFGVKHDGYVVHGTAYHFAKEIERLSEGNTKPVSLDMRHEAMIFALKANLVELETLQGMYDMKLERRHQAALEGHYISPQRLKTLESSAAHDAIEYTKNCIDSQESREHLMLVYRKEFGGSSSIRPVLNTVSTPEAFKSRLAELEQLVGKQQKILPPDSPEDQNSSEQ